MSVYIFVSFLHKMKKSAVKVNLIKDFQSIIQSHICVTSETAFDLIFKGEVPLPAREKINTCLKNAQWIAYFFFTTAHFFELFSKTQEGDCILYFVRLKVFRISHCMRCSTNQAILHSRPFSQPSLLQIHCTRISHIASTFGCSSIESFA